MLHIDPTAQNKSSPAPQKIGKNSGSCHICFSNSHDKSSVCSRHKCTAPSCPRPRVSPSGKTTSWVCRKHASQGNSMADSKTQQAYGGQKRETNEPKKVVERRKPVANGLRLGQPCYMCNSQETDASRLCSRHECQVESCPRPRSLAVGGQSEFYCAEHNSGGRSKPTENTLATPNPSQAQVQRRSSNKQVDMDPLLSPRPNRTENCPACNNVKEPESATTSRFSFGRAQVYRQSELCSRHRCTRQGCTQERFGLREWFCGEHETSRTLSSQLIEGQVVPKAGDEDTLAAKSSTTRENSDTTESEQRLEKNFLSAKDNRLLRWAKRKRDSITKSQQQKENTSQSTDNRPDWPETESFSALVEKQTSAASVVELQNESNAASRPLRHPRKLVGFWGRCHGPEDCRLPAVSETVWVCKTHRSYYKEDDAPGVLDCPASTSK